VSLAAITLCVASQRVFIFAVVYFVMDSVRKLLDALRMLHKCKIFGLILTCVCSTPITFKMKGCASLM
jgi:hypothetical protein